jgi:glutamate-1-semialdehyde 2,1-aminomutase
VRLQNSSIDAAIAEARERYTGANAKSLERQRSAEKSMPGGSTRAVLWYEPFPVTLTGGNGSRVCDLDGHDYVDFVSEYSAGLYGHSEPAIAEAIRDVVDNGWVLGGPNRFEARLAEELVARFPALQKVRFCNSGTEANIMAISTARAITGRKQVVVFREGYHGGVLTFAHGGSELNLPFDYLFADYNDIEGTEALLRQHRATISAVILEQMLGGGGCIRATGEFLNMLRRVTEEIGALLIFDEVMTSRLHFGGMQTINGVTPDLMTLGKYIGGGVSFGAFGGRADLMNRFDPADAHAFSHGGTFNNNIFSMAAGFAGLTKVLTQAASERFNALGERLKTSLQQVLDRHAIAATVTGYGSLMNLHFLPNREVTPANVEAGDKRGLNLWHVEMMLAGQYVAPRGMIALALPHTAADIDGLVAATDKFCLDYRTVLPTVKAGVAA